jgi:hypothetical protein
MFLTAPLCSVSLDLQFGLTLALLIVPPTVRQEDRCSHRKLTIYVQDSLGNLQLRRSLAITDAGDNSSHAVPKDVAKALTSSGVHLFVSLLGSNPAFRNRTPEEIVDTKTGPLSSRKKIASGGRMRKS